MIEHSQLKQMNNNYKIYQKLLKLKECKTLSFSQLNKSTYFANVLQELLDRKIIKEYSPRNGQWSYSVFDEENLNKLIIKYRCEPIKKEIDKVQATELFGNAHSANDSKYPSVPIRTTIKGTKLNNIDIYKICKT